MDNVIIFFGVSVVVAILGMVIAIIGVQYNKALRELYLIKSENERLLKGGSEEINKIIDQARRDSLEILKESQIKAQKIIQTSDIFSREFKEEFRSNLLKFIDQERLSYEQIGKDIQIESNKVLKDLSASIVSQVDMEVKGFHKAISVEAVRTQQAIANNAQEDYKLVRAEIENYKKVMRERINNASIDIVKDIAKQVLGASLTTEEHQKLIIEALKEAKESNVF